MRRRRRHSSGMGALTKSTACDALVRAIQANPKYKGKRTPAAMDAVANKCERNWKKPSKKRSNPKTSHCPTRTVTIKRKRGPSVSFTAHVCPKLPSAMRRRRGKK
jgi:hypothetical protein